MRKNNLKASVLILVLGFLFSGAVTFLWDASQHPWLSLSLRILLPVCVALFSAYFAHQKRMQSILSAFLVSFFESVLCRSLHLFFVAGQQSESFSSLHLSFGEIMGRMGIGFLGMLPVLTIVSFAGAELGNHLRVRKNS